MNNGQKQPQGTLVFNGCGYRHLKTFVIGRLLYDITVRFAELFIPANSRTRDQMVQAARSGVQNIAEGSAASVNSRETEIRLTNVARASLEELTLDYEDYLRQNGLPEWDAEHPLRLDFISRKVNSNSDFRKFVENSLHRFPSMHKEEIVINAALLLLNVETYLLNRQIASQSKEFLEHGGFRERMMSMRRNKRKW